MSESNHMGQEYVVARLAELEARMVRIETAQSYMEKDIKEAFGDLSDEAKFVRRTALTTMISVLSALLLATFAAALSWLVKH